MAYTRVTLSQRLENDYEYYQNDMRKKSVAKNFVHEIFFNVFENIYGLLFKLYINSQKLFYEILQCGVNKFCRNIVGHKNLKNTICFLN